MAVGLGGGAVGAAYLTVLEVVTDLLGPGRWAPVPHLVVVVLVVTEMSGLALLPTTLIAPLVSLALTSQVGLIHTQRRRFTALPVPDDAAPPEMSGRPVGAGRGQEETA